MYKRQGFITSISPDVLQEATLMKGDVPAAYGGRVASVLRLVTRPAGTQGWRLSGGVGTLSSRLVAEGPLAGNRVQLLVGGRLAYPGLALRQFPAPTQRSRAFFYDANARIDITLSKSQRLSLTAYRSGDRFKFPEDTAYAWQSTAAVLRWEARFSPRWSGGVAALVSRYTSEIDGLRPDVRFRMQSGMAQRELNARVLFAGNDRFRAEAGGSLTGYRVQPGRLFPKENSVVNPVQLPAEQARQTAAYVQLQAEPLPWLGLQAGLRWAGYALVGPRTVYAYAEGLPRRPETRLNGTRYAAGQAVGRFGGLEPRLSLRLGLGRSASLKLSYNRSRQFLHLISNTSAISPADFYKLADGFVPPQWADQWAVGWFKNAQENTIEFSVEAYFRNMHQLTEYRNGATLLLNPTLETELLPAEGHTYGLETGLRKKAGRLTGQLAYTYARSLVRTLSPFAAEQLNGGRYYPSFYDRPHTVNVSWQLDLLHGWTFGGYFNYSTGRPFTFPDGRYVFDRAYVLEFSSRNQGRLPAYHRLDVSVSKTTRRHKDQRRYSLFNFSVYNLYSRDNVYSVYFRRYNRSVYAYRLAVLGAAVPSLTWNFYF